MTGEVEKAIDFSLKKRTSGRRKKIRFNLKTARKLKSLIF